MPLTGKVVFDVPLGTQLSTIELHDSAFSEGVKIQLDPLPKPLGAQVVMITERLQR